MGRHALLSDCNSAALVTGAGSVDWLCLPRFDSAPALARLLDDDAGHFLIAPSSDAFSSSWRYRPCGLVLDTTWSSVDGELIVTDAMALGARERGHELGHSAPGVQGLFIAACPDEAGKFFAFLARAAATTQLGRGTDLQIMFGIGGERDLSERELGHLSGWRDSAPVRAGNDAWEQRQLDVYGSLLDAAHTLREQLHDLDEQTRQFLVSAVDAAAQRWDQDDQGLWEIRGPARPYLHSKLMCWVALDRGLALTDQLSPGPEKTQAWTETRARVRESILDNGWSESAGAYTQYYGCDDLDASILLMAILGFLPPGDLRMRASIDAIEHGLSDERGLLYRYRGGDGLEGAEGTFLLCTFWLAHAMAVTGQVQRAREILERAAGYATDLGLFAEQVDTATGELLGNFPQAFSHLGLANAAQALADAERAQPPPQPGGTRLPRSAPHTQRSHR